MQDVQRYIDSKCDSCQVRASTCSFVSPESGNLRNATLSFEDSASDVKMELFSENWHHGVSLCEIDSTRARRLLDSKPALLETLRKAVRCYASDQERDLGPSLNCDHSDRDLEDDCWDAGLDSPGSCAGLYSADCLSQPFDSGISRRNTRYFLIVKAGAGRAARDFHMQLQAALKNNSFLSDALVGPTGIGEQKLRRIEMSARRNRARVLADMATALGASEVATAPDHASHASHVTLRCAVPTVDVKTNFLHQHSNAKTWMYLAGMAEGGSSGGLVTCKNTAGGFLLFAEQDGSLDIHLKNQLGNMTPFGTARTKSSLETLLKMSAAVTQHTPHEDDAWVRDRFAWTHSPQGTVLDLIPMSLWGMHEEERQVEHSAVAMGTVGLRTLKCNPEAVVVPGIESAHMASLAQCRE
jgi:hypothetical protein